MRRYTITDRRSGEKLGVYRGENEGWAYLAMTSMNTDWLYDLYRSAVGTDDKELEAWCWYASCGDPGALHMCAMRSLPVYIDVAICDRTEGRRLAR